MIKKIRIIDLIFALLILFMYICMYVIYDEVRYNNRLFNAISDNSEEVINNVKIISV